MVAVLLAALSLPAGRAVAQAVEPGEEAVCSRGLGLLVGVDRYERLPVRPSVSADLAAMRALLERVSGFERVLVVENEAARRIDFVRLLSVLNDVTPEDCVVVYFSGHSILRGDEAGQVGFILPSVDADTSALAFHEASVSLRVLRVIVEQSPARHVLLLLDTAVGGLLAPYPGTAPAADTTGGVQTRFVLTAAGADDAVAHAGQAHSFLVEALLAGLGAGRADGDSDGAVSMEELGAYVAQVVTVRSDGRQHPVFRAYAPDRSGLRFRVPAPGIADGPVSEDVLAAETATPAPPRAPAYVTVTAELPGAQVSVDGTPVGTTPLDSLLVPSGEVTVEVTLPRHTTWQRHAYLRPGETRAFEAEIGLAEGYVQFVGLPEAARVRVDGVPADYDAVHLALAAGAHDVEVAVPGLSSAASRVEVEPGGQVVLQWKERAFAGRYVIWSTLLPGLGQIRDGAWMKGLGLGVTLVASALAVRSGQQRYRDGLDRLEDARWTYDRATSRQEAVAARERMEAMPARLKQAKGLRVVGLASLIAVYGYNVADAWLAHAIRPGLRIVRGASAPALHSHASFDADGVRLSLHLTF